MRRFCSSILLFTFLLLSSVQAQQEVSYFSIGGDVKAPQTYQWPQGLTVHLRDLVSQAGMESLTGYALVFRGQDLTLAAVERVNSAGVERGSMLKTGDIVVFQAPSEARFPGEHNAFVLTGGIPDVLSFDSPGCAVDTFLDRLSLPALQQITVTRTSLGNPVTLTLDRTAMIVHGDIIHLAKDANLAGIPLGDLANSFVAPPQGIEPGFRISDVAGPVAENSSFESPDGMTGMPVLSIPGGSDAAGENDESIFGSHGSDSEIRSVSRSSGGGQMELRIAGSGDGSRDGFSSNAAPLHTASLQTSASADNSFPASHVSAASQAAADTGGSFIWNMIFFTGLLLATGLIAFGWLKARQEQSMEAEVESNLRKTVSMKPALPAEPSVDLTSERVPESTLEETFEAAETVDDDCPVLSAGLETTVAALSDEKDDASDSRQIPEELTPLDTVVADTVEIPIFGEDWLVNRPVEVSREIAGHADQDAGAMSAPSALNAESDNAGPSAAGPDSVTAEEHWSDLEDLIRNRLPVELTELELPLKVNLFGRPAGPKRLRIDAAHTQVDAPHMLKKKARSGRSRTVSATQTNSSAEEGDRGKSTDADIDVSRLDRALNYLEEQSGL